MPMLFRTNPSLGVPIYLQLIEQVRHAIDTGVLRAGEQLPAIRPLAEELVINPNTVAKAYRELEHDGVIELRHGAGAFVTKNPVTPQVTDKLRNGQGIVAAAVKRLRAGLVSDDDIRRLFEAELAGLNRNRLPSPRRARWRTHPRSRRSISARPTARSKRSAD